MADPAKKFRFECECGRVIEIELGATCPHCKLKYEDEGALEVAAEALAEKEEEEAAKKAARAEKEAAPDGEGGSIKTGQLAVAILGGALVVAVVLALVLI